MRELIGGYDITSYATDPNHLSKVQSILKSIQKIGLPQYLRRLDPDSPVTLEMILASAQKYSVDPNVMAAIMQNDSGMGRFGKGSRTHNPGNVGNDDTGKLVDWKTWEAGVDAVARWLSRHRA